MLKGGAMGNSSSEIRWIKKKKCEEDGEKLYLSEAVVGHIFNDVGEKVLGEEKLSVPLKENFHILFEKEVKIWNGFFPCENRGGRKGFFKPRKFGIEFYRELVEAGEKLLEEEEKEGEGCYLLEGNGKKVDKSLIDRLLNGKESIYDENTRFPRWDIFVNTALLPVKNKDKVYQAEEKSGDSCRGVGEVFDPCNTTTLFYKKQLDEILELKKSKEKEEGGKWQFLLINGDFWGIQSFIFKRLSIKGAPKMLRSRSAYVELLTYFLAWRIAKELKGYVIRATAGQFGVIVPVKVKETENGKYKPVEESENITVDEAVGSAKLKWLKKFEKSVNDYFISNFFGLNGLMLHPVVVSEEELKDAVMLRYKLDEANWCSEDERERLREQAHKRERLTEEIRTKIEERKLRKHADAILGPENPVINIFENAETDNSICQLCHARPGKGLKKDLQLSESEAGNLGLSDEWKENLHICNICLNQIRLGKRLIEEYKYFTFTSKPVDKPSPVELIEIEGEKWFVQFMKKPTSSNSKDDPIFMMEEKEEDRPLTAINSYVARLESNGSKGRVKSFDELTLLDGKEEGEEKYSRLMALKADVDHLGSTFRKLTKISFTKTNRLSRELDYFFSVYFLKEVVQKEKYRNWVYVIFAGGDDLFLIGRYDKVYELAKELGEKFRAFTMGKASISIGLAIFNHHTPVTAIARQAEEAEKLAKNCPGCWRGKFEDEKGPLFLRERRDGIALFDIPMKFDDFLAIEAKWHEILKLVGEIVGGIEKIPTSFFYRLLKIAEMADKSQLSSHSGKWKWVNGNEKDEKGGDIKAALWLSKLNYLVRRNIGGSLEKQNRLIDELKNLFSSHGKRVIPAIQITLYKKRDGLIGEGQHNTSNP